jgi:hypothetical protein
VNKQEIFTTVKNHLLSQNARSVNDYDECVYRGVDGKMCAIGCLMPDHLYDPECEGHNSLDTKVQRCLPMIKFPDGDDWGGPIILFLNGLQDIHDKYNVEEWPAELNKFALKHSLE